MCLREKHILSLSPRSKKHPLYQYLFDLIDHLELEDYQCYYFYACPWGSGTDYPELSAIDYRAETIIFYAEDNLVGKSPHIWYEEIRPYGLVEIEKICLKHPDKKFILVNIQYDLQKLVSVHNLECIGLLPIGQVQRDVINSLTPYIDKKDSDGKSWITLNHTPSHSRICFLSYVLYKNLDHYGNLAVSDRLIKECQQYNDPSEFTYYVLDMRLKKQLKKGFQRLKNRDFNTIDLDPYDHQKQNDDFSNYYLLARAYQKSRLEIVTSSLYSEPTPQVSEKEIQTIYGCNFFIMIGNPNLIKLLRKWGFDVFDDVIDHSYDSVLNPSWRLFKAIDDNINLLNGNTDLDALWKENQHRFLKNYQLMKEVHETIEKNFVAEFKSAIKRLKIPHADKR